MRTSLQLESCSIRTPPCPPTPISDTCTHIRAFKRAHTFTCTYPHTHTHTRMHSPRRQRVPLGGAAARCRGEPGLPGRARRGRQQPHARACRYARLPGWQDAGCRHRGWPQRVGGHRCAGGCRQVAMWLWSGTGARARMFASFITSWHEPHNACSMGGEVGREATHQRTELYSLSGYSQAVQ